MYVFVVMDLNLLKKLFVSAVLLMPCFFSYAQMTERSVELHFRQGSSKYEPNYRGNAERLRQFSDEIVSLHRDKYEITSAEFHAGTSPEGSERLNTRLSAERLRNGIAAFLAVMGDDIVLHGEELTVSSASAGTWEDLASLLEAGSDFEGRDTVLKVLRDSSLSHKAKTTALHRLGGGIWNYLTNIVFPELRVSGITIRLALAERLPDTVPAVSVVRSFRLEPPVGSICAVPLKPNTPPEGLFDKEEWGRQLRVGTNAVGLGLLLGNLSAEVDITRNLSFHLPVYYSALNYFTSTIKFRALGFQPELRWNFTRPAGLFVGAHFGLAYFNLATDGNWRIQTHNGNEPLIGGGVSIGYRLPLSKDKRWNLDFVLGAGAYRFNYDKFYNEPNGALAGSVSKTYWGLDNAALNFSYSFDLRRGRKK